MLELLKRKECINGIKTKSKSIHTLLNNKEFLKHAKKTSYFMATHRLARENAGMAEKEGAVSFHCPLCGTLCNSSFVWFNGCLHGRTGCTQCKIDLSI